MKLFSLIFLTLLILCSCLTTNKETDNTKVKIDESDLASQFIVALIKSGELDGELRLELAPDELDYNFIEELLHSSKTEEYKYQPDVYRSQAIQAYVDYGMVKEEEEVDQIKKEEDTSLSIGFDTIARTFFIPTTFSTDSSMRPRHNLSDTTIKQLLDNLSKCPARPFDNSKLGFNQGNTDYWYRLSYPIFNSDNSVAIIKISRLCKGLCGAGDLFLFEKRKNGSWKKVTLKSWWH